MTKPSSVLIQPYRKNPYIQNKQNIESIFNIFRFKIPRGKEVFNNKLDVNRILHKKSHALWQKGMRKFTVKVCRSRKGYNNINSLGIDGLTQLLLATDGFHYIFSQFFDRQFLYIKIHKKYRLANKAFLLLKAIYGLKQSTRQWAIILSKALSTKDLIC